MTHLQPSFQHVGLFFFGGGGDIFLSFAEMHTCGDALWQIPRLSIPILF